MSKKYSDSDLTVLGVTCGIGSMLQGAKNAGFRVLGNIEWRGYYHTGTFEKNFDAPMTKDYNSIIPEWERPTLIMGHTECGNYSNLSTTTKHQMNTSQGDIPEFVEMIQVLQPRFFAMDNLPGSLTTFTIHDWVNELGSRYDLFPEWISNYHYGNTQFHRRRLFMIGARKEERFVFYPCEREHNKTVEQVFRQIRTLHPNHIALESDDLLRGWKGYQIDRPNKKELLLRDFQKHIKDWPSRKIFEYINKKGERQQKPGYYKIKMDYRAPVLTGGGSGAFDNHYREDLLRPLTIHERALIQGLPVSFILYPLSYMTEYRQGQYKSYLNLIKQTGKCMPVEFCEYLAGMIINHINHLPPTQIHRCIKSNPIIDRAKQWYCDHVAYRHQRQVCEACGSRGPKC